MIPQNQNGASLGSFKLGQAFVEDGHLFLDARRWHNWDPRRGQRENKAPEKLNDTKGSGFLHRLAQRQKRHNLDDPSRDKHGDGEVEAKNKSKDFCPERVRDSVRHDDGDVLELYMERYERRKRGTIR